MLIDFMFSLNKGQDHTSFLLRWLSDVFLITYVIFHQSVAGNLAKIDLASYMRLQILAYIANTYYRMAV